MATDPPPQQQGLVSDAAADRIAAIEKDFHAFKQQIDSSVKQQNEAINQVTTSVEKINTTVVQQGATMTTLQAAQAEGDARAQEMSNNIAQILTILKTRNADSSAEEPQAKSPRTS